MPGACAIESVEAKRLGKEPDVVLFSNTAAGATATETARELFFSAPFVANAFLLRRRLAQRAITRHSGLARGKPYGASAAASRQKPTHLSGQSGFALLEALIAIMIFSLGVLALVGLQAAMSKNLVASQMRGEASVLATELVGAMWVDKEANLGTYAVVANACTAAANPRCSNWTRQVAAQLPQGSSNVAINGALVDINVSWQLPGESSPGRYDVQASVKK